MQNLEKIESLLPDLSTKEFELLQNLIQKQINDNRLNFNKAITEGNVEKIDLLIEKVNFDETYINTLRKQVVPHVKSLHYIHKKIFQQKFHISDRETINTFHLLFKDILDLGNFNDFYQKNYKEKLTFPLNDVLFAALFHRLKLNFEYSGEEPYPKYLFIKSLLGNNEEAFTKTLKSFCDYSLAKINYQENSLLINELLKLGFKDTLFQQAKNEENYKYLKSIANFNNIYDEKFMLSGLSKYHFSMVKECFEHGVPFFKYDETMSKTEKAHYKNVFSSVFSSKESFEIQDYIIENIDKINVANHIIVKTILHKLEDTYETDFERNDKRIELISKIIQRYQELEKEEVLSFQELLKKRKDSYAKNLFEKFIDYYLLSKKFQPTEFTVKKHKI